MTKRLNIEHRVEDTPGAIFPRLVVWAFAVCVIPYTFGLSLLGGLIFEGLCAVGRREVKDRMDREDPAFTRRACDFTKSAMLQGKTKIDYERTAQVVAGLVRVVEELGGSY